MGSLSTAKAIFLLVSMVGWLLAGAALIYLMPAIADLLLSSDRTHQWLTTLARGGYYPRVALGVGLGLLLLEAIAYWVWYRQGEGKA